VNINRDAPATAEGEVQISANPDTVWQVLADLERWPTWNPDIRSIALDGPLAPGSVFRWKAGTSLTSTLQVVDRPRELAWTGTTMGINAVHVFRFEPRDGGTRASSEESWEGLLPRLFKRYSRRTLDRGIRTMLARLKVESERRAAA
jgi:uncharacterized protein YndB with AHSA1/START domain